MTSRKRELEAGNRKQGRSMGIGEGERRGEVCGYFITGLGRKERGKGGEMLEKARAGGALLMKER